MDGQRDKGKRENQLEGPVEMAALPMTVCTVGE